MARQELPIFPHHRLDAYRVALQLVVAAHKLADGIPRGHRTVADQIQRASTSVVLNIAEAANRCGKGEKRQRFGTACGECGEVAAAAELAGVLGLADDARVRDVMELADRVLAMTNRLVRRFS